MDYINQSITNPPKYIVMGAWWPGEGTNCTGWAVNAWNYAGLPVKWGVTNHDAWNPYGQGMVAKVRAMLSDTSDEAITAVYQKFLTGKNTISPLVLDLDGDGIETLSPTTGIHFDHNGNGFAEATGWVGKDDALLVWDRNLNGKIDNGTELFGNATVLSNGRHAANGFEALSELDEDHDGLVSASDTHFSSLRLWQDKDTDAQVDAGELVSLQDAGVDKLPLAYEYRATSDEVGNSLRQRGHFETTDGLSHEMVDVWFGVDHTKTVDQHSVTVDAHIASLPDLPGAGTVCSLQQAMAKDTSGYLQALVAQACATEDPTALRQHWDSIMYAWSGSSDYAPDSRHSALGDARKLVTLEAFLSERFIQYSGGDPDPGYDASKVLVSAYERLSDAFYFRFAAQTVYRPWYDSISVRWDEEATASRVDCSELVDHIKSLYADDPARTLVALEEFSQSLHFCGLAGVKVLDMIRHEGETLNGELGQSMALAGYWHTTGSSGPDQLKGLSDYDNYITGGEGGDFLQGAARDDVLDGGAGDDRIEAGAGDDKLVGGAGADYVSGGDGNDRLSGDDGDDVLYGDDGDDVLMGGDGNDKLMGGSGNDVLVGGLGKNVLAGNSGDDIYIITSAADNFIDAYDRIPEADIIRFIDVHSEEVGHVERFCNDLIIRYRDSSVLQVQNAFSNDFCTLKQIEFSDGTVWSSSDLCHRIDGISGTNSQDYLFGFSSLSNHILGLAGNDRITGGNVADVIDGGNDDDVIHALAGNDRAQGGLGDDSVEGDAGDDWLDGGAGNDALDGGEGDDTLIGGDGNDALTGGSGNDTLEGGTGDDVLTGGAGRDIYVIRGGGNDLIYVGDPAWNVVNSTNAEQIFLTELTPADIKTVRGSFANLILDYAGGSLDVDGYFSDSHQTRFSISFKDGSVWEYADVRERLAPLIGSEKSDHLNGLVAEPNRIIGLDGSDFLFGGNQSDLIMGGAGADYIDTYNGDDRIWGDDGNDTAYAGLGNDEVEGGNGDDRLYGDTGDDVLNGGDGNDFLWGGDGNDRLVGGAGDNHLTGGMGEDAYLISSNGNSFIFGVDENGKANALSEDSVIFTDARPDDIHTIYRDSYDLTIMIGASGQLTIDDYFRDTANQIGKFSFSDGRIWDSAAAMQSMIVRGSDFSDWLRGDTGRNNRIDGKAGDDYLTGAELDDWLDGGSGSNHLRGLAGNDILKISTNGAPSNTIPNNLLEGGDGEDTLYGGAGADLLIGGQGNDAIYTGNGASIIAFNRGDGQDTIIQGQGAGQILSLGGGITMSDVQTTRLVNDLLIDTGSMDQIRIRDWFIADHQAGVQQIQTIEATNGRPSVKIFDLPEVVDGSKLPISTFMQTAYGGDLAYGYGTNGNLSDYAEAVLPYQITADDFGLQPQNIHTHYTEEHSPTGNPDAPFGYSQSFWVIPGDDGLPVYVYMPLFIF